MKEGKSFKSLSEEHLSVLKLYGNIIKGNDLNVKEEFGSIMGVKNTFNYLQKGVFKYGLARTANYFTFHSMVIYAFPELLDNLKQELKNVTFQKGCINFKTIEDFSLEVFRKHLIESSQKDFSGVIEHYQRKK